MRTTSYEILRQSGDGPHREVCRVREQDCPRALDPLVPVHWPLSCVSVKVGDNIAKTQNLIIVSATHIDRYALAYNTHLSEQEKDARSYPIGRALRVELGVQLGAGLDVGVTHRNCSEKVQARYNDRQQVLRFSPLSCDTAACSCR